MICLSYLEPGSFTNARYLVRRLRRRASNVAIIVGFWTLSNEGARQVHALRETGADHVVTSLRQAVEWVVSTTESAGSVADPALPNLRFHSAAE